VVKEAHADADQYQRERAEAARSRGVRGVSNA
jgi:hypothetical protein